MDNIFDVWGLNLRCFYESYVEEGRLLFDTAVAHHLPLTSLDVEQQMILLLCFRYPSIIMSVSILVNGPP